MVLSLQGCGAMWSYDSVSRREFEERKGYVEQVMCELGAVRVDAKLPYDSKRSVFQFNGEYFRVDELLGGRKPFLVIECGTFEEVMKNTMEDADPFPYDLPEEEIKNEVKCVFSLP